VKPDERADPQPSIDDTHAIERKLVGVDDDARRRQAIGEERNETLATREDFRVVTVLAQKRERVLETVGRDVVERRDYSTSRSRATSARPSMNSPILRPSVLK
jgi:hypothetical protein